MTALRISTVDPCDDRGLRDYWSVTEPAQRHDRPHALLESFEALVASLRDPGSDYRTELLLARDGETPVGAANVGTHLGDNAHLADLEVNVHPHHRRRGVGRELHDHALTGLRAAGCTTTLCEVNVPDGAATWPALSFAGVLGYESVNLEDHLLLDLPATPPRAALPPDWEVLTWVDRCPDEHLDAYCDMRTRMNADVPLGEVDWQPVRRTPEQQRESERRLAASYTSIVASVRRSVDGVLGGYSMLFLPHGSEVVWQDDTLVMPEFRGQRLGLVLKNATLDVVSRDHPGRTCVHTWTSPDNVPMQRTNAEFGFRPVERMHEVQRRIA